VCDDQVIIANMTAPRQYFELANQMANNAELTESIEYSGLKLCLQNKRRASEKVNHLQRAILSTRTLIGVSIVEVAARALYLRDNADKTIKNEGFANKLSAVASLRSNCAHAELRARSASMPIIIWHLDFIWLRECLALRELTTPFGCTMASNCTQEHVASTGVELHNWHACILDLEQSSPTEACEEMNCYQSYSAWIRSVLDVRSGRISASRSPAMWTRPKYIMSTK